jgi:hypothetical protein
VIVLGTLKRVFFPLLETPLYFRLHAKLCCCWRDKSCLQNEVESVVEREWKTTLAMEKLL